MHLVSVGRLTKEHSTKAQRAAVLHSVRPDLMCWQSMQNKRVEQSVVNMTYPGWQRLIICCNAAELDL